MQSTNEQRAAAHIVGVYTVLAAFISGSLGFAGGWFGARGYYYDNTTEPKFASSTDDKLTTLPLAQEESAAKKLDDVQIERQSPAPNVTTTDTEPEDSFITLTDYLTLRSNKAGLSSLAQAKSVKEHDGKRIHWTGYYQDVDISPLASEEQYFRLRITPTSDRGLGYVYCYQPKSAESRIAKLVEGQKIKFSGVLKSEVFVYTEEFEEIESVSSDNL